MKPAVVFDVVDAVDEVAVATRQVLLDHVVQQVAKVARKELGKLELYTCNKAVTDCRLRPRCCHLGSYFKHPKSSSEHPLACNWYYCTQYSQAQGCGDVEQPWLMSRFMMSSIKPEVHNVSLRRRRSYSHGRTVRVCGAKIGRAVPKI